MIFLEPKTEEQIINEAKKMDPYPLWRALKRIKNNEVIRKYIHLLKTNLFQHYTYHYEHEYWILKKFKTRTVTIENSHFGNIKTIQYVHLLNSYRPIWLDYINGCLEDLKDEKRLLLEAIKEIKKYNKSWVEKQ